MKKVLSLALCLALLALNLPALSESTDAWSLAFSALAQAKGISQEIMKKGQIVKSDTGWTFSISTSQALYVGEIDENGSLLSLTEEAYLLDDFLEADLKACFNQPDCYLLLPDVCAKWQAIYPTLTEDEMDHLWLRYVLLTQLNITVPDENALPFEDAYELALQYLAQQPRWSEETAHMLRLVISFYYTPEGTEQPVYLFFLQEHSLFEEAYSSDAVWKAYCDDLKQKLGGVGLVGATIVINAYDGSLMEDPLILYVGELDLFNYLDLVLRPQALYDALAESREESP